VSVDYELVNASSLAAAVRDCSQCRTWLSGDVVRHQGLYFHRSCFKLRLAGKSASLQRRRVRKGSRQLRHRAHVGVVGVRASERSFDSVDAADLHELHDDDAHVDDSADDDDDGNDADNADSDDDDDDDDASNDERDNMGDAEHANDDLLHKGRHGDDAEQLFDRFVRTATADDVDDDTPYLAAHSGTRVHFRARIDPLAKDATAIRTRVSRFRTIDAGSDAPPTPILLGGGLTGRARGARSRTIGDALEAGLTPAEASSLTRARNASLSPRGAKGSASGGSAGGAAVAAAAAAAASSPRDVASPRRKQSTSPRRKDKRSPRMTTPRSPRSPRRRELDRASPTASPAGTLRGKEATTRASPTASPAGTLRGVMTSPRRASPLVPLASSNSTPARLLTTSSDDVRKGAYLDAVRNVMRDSPKRGASPQQPQQQSPQQPPSQQPAAGEKVVEKAPDKAIEKAAEKTASPRRVRKAGRRAHAKSPRHARKRATKPATKQATKQATSDVRPVTATATITTMVPAVAPTIVLTASTVVMDDESTELDAETEK
jgi:hypothetical protein